MKKTSKCDTIEKIDKIRQKIKKKGLKGPDGQKKLLKIVMKAITSGLEELIEDVSFDDDCFVKLSWEFGGRLDYHLNPREIDEISRNIDG